MTPVDVVLPDGVDDPGRPSGGNAYDRRLCDGLAAAGWRVREHAVPGPWPVADAAAHAALARVVAGVPDGRLLLVDGLVASGAPDVLVPEARRLRLVVLAHMLIGDAAERAVLQAAGAVVTTSGWAQGQACARHGLRPDRVHLARPGVDAAAETSATAGGGRLLCVGAVSPHKGHDVLVAALAALADLSWRCRCVGTLTRDPEFVASLRRRAQRAAIDDRLSFDGPRVAAQLERAYTAADLLVLPSRGESYGMVITEALARAVPVVATGIGGVPEAVGHLADGTRPGLLVPPDDATALAAALRRWLTDAGLRHRLRAAARARRKTLSGWPVTVDRVAGVLRLVAG